MKRASFISVLAVAAAIGSGVAAGAPMSAQGKAPIVVGNVSELQAALVPANAGRLIVVRAGTYGVSSPLLVPDGATLAGEGVMLGDALPTGFAPGTRTLIRALPVFSGDILQLGNGSSLSDLTLEDSAGRSGNAVGVRSREPGDTVSASISECEIATPNPASAVIAGPTGRAVAVLTQNPGLGAAPPPHEGAHLDLLIRRSIVRAPGGGSAVFAVNFASNAEIDLQLYENVLVGALDAVGGVARPDAVSFASTTIDSHDNSYVSNDVAWSLHGGASAPIPIVTAPTSSNALNLRSVGDRVEAARIAVFAIGGQRSMTVGGLVSDNTLDMKVRGLSLSTPSGASDLVLAGAFPGGEFPPGDRNTLTVDIRDSSGSGPRANFYRDTLAAVLPEYAGVGNRLHVAGTLLAFVRDNPGIDPAPGAEFFD
jgi:hypothetical protein